MSYQSDYSGAQVDEAVGKALNPDAAPTEGSTNLVQSGGVASAVSAVSNAVSRRNLLDNWYFVGGGSQQGGGRFPINQRGQTSYSGTGYGIDRWKIVHSSIGQEIQSDCLRWKCTTAIGSGNVIYAYFYPTNPLPAGTYTISFLVKGLDGGGTWYFSSGTGGYSMGNIAMSVGLVSKTFVATGSETSPSFYLWHQNALAVNGYLDIVAAKLEVGSTQTLAHQENGVWVVNDIPNFVEELQKCQYYFYRLKAGEPLYGRRSIGSASYAVFRAPIIMRTTPTATKDSGNIIIYGQSGVQYTFSSFNNQWVTYNAIGLYLSANANYAGESLEMFCESGTISLSAEP